MIPFIQPDLTEKEAQAAYQVVLSGFVNEGRLTDQFQERFAQTVGARYAVATTSCTAALALSLMALEIRDKEVIVPDLTMVGTAMAVLLSGNTPVVVDVKPEDGCMDPAQVEKALTPKTAAVIPVHVNGRNAATPELLHLTRQRRLPVIEDAASGLGSAAPGTPPAPLGTLGILGCFSLAATKIATTGQGGVIVTNDPALYERCVRLKDWGRYGVRGMNHDQPGFNFKFTDIQAAIGLQQLERLPHLVARKKKIYARYRQHLGDRMFSLNDPESFCPWYADIRGQDWAGPLAEKGIHTNPIWPALHKQGALRTGRLEGSYPVAETLAREILWLPSSTRLTDEQIDSICEALRVCIS